MITILLDISGRVEGDEYNFRAPIESDMQNTTMRTSNNSGKYQSILSDNEARVYKFIKEKPGISKEDIARHFTNLSRVTILKNLKLLEEKELIISSANPKNRQTHSASKMQRF